MKSLTPLLLLLALTFSACDTTDAADADDVLGKKAKVELCHYDADADAFYYIEVSQRAERAHLAHGDVAYDSDDDDNPEDGIYCEPEPNDDGDGGGDPVEMTLYGTDTGSDALYTIDRVTGATTIVGSGFDPSGNANFIVGSMATATDGTIYVVDNINSLTSRLLTVDACTGVATVVGTMAAEIGGLASDPTTGKLYGVNRALYEIDAMTGAATRIGVRGSDRFFGAAFSDDGTL